MGRTTHGVMAMVAALGVASPGAQMASLTLSEDPQLRLQVEGRELLRMRVGPGQATGPTARLTWSNRSLAGTVAGRGIQLQLGPGAVAGAIGGSAVRLSLAQLLSGGFSLQGWMGKERVQLEITSARVSGVVGGCRYEMARAAETYRGWQDCDGNANPVAAVLRLPAALAEAPDPVRGSMVLVTLSAAERVPPVVAAHKSPRLSRLGLTVNPSPPGESTGVEVARVEALSPAAAAGIDEGMFITHIGVEDVRTPDELETALSRAEPGAMLRVRAVAAEPNKVYYLALQLPEGRVGRE